MPKCANCGHDNPVGKLFCEQCGNRIGRVVPPPEPDPEDLLEKIQALQRDLLMREEEIKKLNDDLIKANDDKEKMAEKHPKVETLIQQLDEKDRALQDALKKHQELLSQLPEPPPVTPGSKPYLVIESHPIPNPDFGITFDDNAKSLDLSTTGFRIRATLERNSDGSVGLVIHPGAMINIKTPPEKRWRRFEGGARLSTKAGMVLFDAKGIANARLDQRS
jgi:hypothetical protein